MYFFLQKAIMECEGEWAMNKQVIQIKDKPITKMVFNFHFKSNE